jgi:predicted RNA binding protein YcfA (HicA-like mRNA interferase family)
VVTASAVVRVIERLGGVLVRRKGSHAIYRTPDGCQTVVPLHTGDIPVGTLRAIQRQLEPCLGKGWLGR